MMNGIGADAMMDTSYNFTRLVPNNTYLVSIFSRLSSCFGINSTIMVTTVAVEEGVPVSKLLFVCMYVYV